MVARQVSSRVLGDPLSPYLFVLGMEALSILIDEAVRGGGGGGGGGGAFCLVLVLEEGKGRMSKSRIFFLQMTP